MPVRYSKFSTGPHSARYFRFGSGLESGAARAPLLERLLARADEEAALGDWRREAFGCIAPPDAGGAPVPMPGIAAVALCAERPSAGRPEASAPTSTAPAASLFLATPVSYVAEIDDVRLDDPGIIALSPAEARTLAQDFERVWGDAMPRLLAAPSGRLYLSMPPVEAATRDPSEARGLPIHDYLPSGADGPLLRRLMSEMEMWLFEHLINRQRSAAGQPTVSGLWVWGGGAEIGSLPPIRGWTAGDDVYFAAWADHGTAPGPAGAISEPEGGGARSTAGVIAVSACPGTPEWSDVEMRWLVPAVAALRDGEVDSLILSAGSRRYRLTRGALRRFWRRARLPWREFFTEAPA